MVIQIVIYHNGRWTENNKKKLGEYKVITPKQQFLGIILCFLCIQNGCGYCVSLRKGCRSSLNFFYFYDFKLKLLLQHF